MFGFMKKRLRGEHLKLLREIVARGEQLTTFAEQVASTGLDNEGRYQRDSVLLRSIVTDVRQMLGELEATEGGVIPPEAVQPMLDLWSEFGERLKVIESAKSVASSVLPKT